MSDGGVGSKSSLTWACHRPCPFMCAGRRLCAVVSCAVVFVRVRSVVVRVRSFPFVGVHHCSWAFISVSGHASSSVGVHLRSWAFILSYRWPALFVRMCFGIVVRRWEVVDPRGRLWCSRVVAGGASFVVVGHVTWASLLMLEKEVGGWGYGTHLHAQ